MSVLLTKICAGCRYIIASTSHPHPPSATSKLDKIGRSIAHPLTQDAFYLALTEIRTHTRSHSLSAEGTREVRRANHCAVRTAKPAWKLRQSPAAAMAGTSRRQKVRPSHCAHFNRLISVPSRSEIPLSGRCEQGAMQDLTRHWSCSETKVSDQGSVRPGRVRTHAVGAQLEHYLTPPKPTALFPTTPRDACTALAEPGQPFPFKTGVSAAPILRWNSRLDGAATSAQGL